MNTKPKTIKREATLRTSSRLKTQKQPTPETEQEPTEAERARVNLAPLLREARNLPQEDFNIPWGEFLGVKPKMTPLQAKNEKENPDPPNKEERAP